MSVERYKEFRTLILVVSASFQIVVFEACAVLGLSGAIPAGVVFLSFAVPYSLGELLLNHADRITP